MVNVPTYTPVQDTGTTSSQQKNSLVSLSRESLYSVATVVVHFAYSQIYFNTLLNNDDNLLKISFIVLDQCTRIP